MPVHCYGHPCDVEALQKIADTYNLRVIYDAAHAFGVEDQFGSIVRYGDLSVLSFHATKVFNTFEGGAIVCPDAKSKARIDQLKNFGHAGETNVVAPGINGKMSEFPAALGLLQLKHVDRVIAMRAKIDAMYRDRLSGVPGIVCLANAAQRRANHAYFPILVGEEFRMTRDEVYAALKERGIHPRRYFYPLISEFPMYRGLPSSHRDNLPNATKAASQILCLPIYPDLEPSVVNEVCDFFVGK